MKKHGTFTKSMLTGLAVLMLVGIGGWLVRGSNAFYRQDGAVNFATLKSSNNNGALTAQMWDSLVDGIIALDAKVASAPSSGGSQGGGGGTEETPSPSGPIPEECFYVDQSGTLKGYLSSTWGTPHYELWRKKYPNLNENDFNKMLLSICPGNVPVGGPYDPWDFIVPEKVKGRTIKAIDLHHGAGFWLVRSITIPDSVESILRFPSRPSSSVYNKEVTLRLGKKVKYIWANTFAGYYMSSIVIPDSVKVIGAQAFTNSRVRSLVLGSGVQTIGDRAFAGHSLSSLVIPDNVRQIWREAFHWHAALTRSSLYAPLVHVTLGKGIREIALGAFLDNKSLVSVQMPEGLERIGSCAFAETAVMQVDLPSSLQQIERGAFAKGLKRSSTEQILVSDCSNRKISNRNRSNSNYSPSMLPAVVGYLKKPITEVSNTPEQTNIRLEQVP